MIINKKNGEEIKYSIVAIVLLLLLLIGATYAYFSIRVNKNTKNSNLTGSADTMPKGILVTKTTGLKINLNANLMSEENVGITYYATENGVPVTTATEVVVNTF